MTSTELDHSENTAEKAARLAKEYAEGVLSADEYFAAVDEVAHEAIQQELARVG